MFLGSISSLILLRWDRTKKIEIDLFFVPVFFPELLPGGARETHGLPGHRGCQESERIGARRQHRVKDRGRRWEGKKVGSCHFFTSINQLGLTDNQIRFGKGGVAPPNKLTKVFVRFAEAEAEEGRSRFGTVWLMEVTVSSFLSHWPFYSEQLDA